MLLHTQISHSCFSPARLYGEGSPAPLWPHGAVRRGAPRSSHRLEWGTQLMGTQGQGAGSQRELLLGRDGAEEVGSGWDVTPTHPYHLSTAGVGSGGWSRTG